MTPLDVGRFGFLVAIEAADKIIKARQRACSREGATRCALGDFVRIKRIPSVKFVAVAHFDYPLFLSSLSLLTGGGWDAQGIGRLAPATAHGLVPTPDTIC